MRWATVSAGRRVIVATVMVPVAMAMAAVIFAVFPSSSPFPLFVFLVVLCYFFQEISRRNEFEAAEDDHFGSSVVSVAVGLSDWRGLYRSLTGNCEERIYCARQKECEA